MKGAEKAASIYKLLGEKLPPEIFARLSNQELEKLLNKLSNHFEYSKKDETILLKEFIEKLNHSTQKNFHTTTSKNHSSSGVSPEEMEAIIQDIQNLLQEEKNPETSPSEFLSQLPPETVFQLIADEPAYIISQILLFSPDKTCQYITEKLPKPIKEEIILELRNLDYHSFQLRDELDRFLKFKYSLLKEGKPQLRKTPGQQTKKAAYILGQLNPNESKEILSKIQKKDPQFAENIIEHYYGFQDLLLLGRKSLSEFLGGFHPVVVATALKGLDSQLESDILKNIEPWLAKEIMLEYDSLGPVSLAEIEEAQRGILESLREELESGNLRLWRFM